MKTKTALAILPALISSVFLHSAWAQTIVRIGHAAPTTNRSIGGQAQGSENGARLAIEELNQAGVVIDGQPVTLELVAVNDEADPRVAVRVAQKLVDAKVAGVVGHFNSGTSIPASLVYQSAGIPQITPSATNPYYTQRGIRTAFRVIANDTELGAGLARYAASELKVHAVGVVDDNTFYGKVVSNAFASAAQAAGLQVLERKITTPTSTEFSDTLRAFKDGNAELIFFGGMDMVAIPMLKQMHEMGMHPKYMGGDGICSAELAKGTKSAVLDGQIICAEAGGVLPGEAAVMQDFIKRYQNRFHIPSTGSYYAPFSYDAVQLMVAAMVTAGSSDPAKYLPILAATKNYPGVTGTLTFDDKGEIKAGALTLKTTKGGDLEELTVIR